MRQESAVREVILKEQKERVGIRTQYYMNMVQSNKRQLMDCEA